MTTEQYEAFDNFRVQFKAQCKKWVQFADELMPLQKQASLKDTPEYSLENAIVYNTSLDSITQSDNINLIVIGDNPGKEEQFSVNQKYLVGQSGRIAEGFFKRNPELGTDFRKNVIILNKTPVHTAKTNHLKYLQSKGSDEIKKLLLETQNWMAENTALLHQKLIQGSGENSFIPQLWLVGYAELKNKGFFIPYRNKLQETYLQTNYWEKVFVYQHFSMNRFTIDLKSFRSENPELTLSEAINQLGLQHKNEIFAG